MKKGLLIILAFFFVISVSQAQRWKLKRYEAIAGLGVANVFGDIGGSSEIENWGGFKDFRIRDSRPSIYLGARYRLTEEQALKLNIITGIGAGNDIDSKNYPSGRTYKFSTILLEPSLQYEYYFLPEDRNMKTSAMYSRRGMVNTFSMISMYGFVGIGGVLYSPKIEGESPAPTQETLNEATGFTAVVPVGLGIKYVLTSEVSLNLEIGRRFTRNDYIDGFTSTFSDSYDVYYFGTLSVVYKLTTSRRGIPILFENRSRGRSNSGGPRRGRKPIGF